MGLDDVLARVAQAAEAAGRDPAEITLIAVSKVQPNARVKAVLQAGHRVFGENKVQEAQGKWPDFRAAFAGVELHLLGPLQTNKIKPALELFDVIHSLDRDKLARKLADAAQARGACPPLFVQVNTGREPQKAGIDPDDLDAFIARCRDDYALPLAGLMVIPPMDDAPRPHFDALAEMAARNGLAGLSMGMSGDFEAAIAAGATHIRVGSALFGARDYG
ncbi:YggS family pyridoxal phosphate-dependent enzyme [Abyssibius alkaniclasticus]|uniref:YggS family pyridoxal phosphate-dependent enzyme n=1 Tax=Abyssibius alkaniclasticus TaxID=2881234 RepID=UPI0023638E14|nr:YggS family pyridoxal phosphate-dependent enzyme [Abyssibius alkaniclasticus]UPH72069.1 YggS family pyridoxal phosphate-dependent enzyme [Abyssibius alkaniclasticus]